jgi:low affinity Fe/Cu permease
MLCNIIIWKQVFICTPFHVKEVVLHVYFSELLFMFKRCCIMAIALAVSIEMILIFFLIDNVMFYYIWFCLLNDCFIRGLYLDHDV